MAPRKKLTKEEIAVKKLIAATARLEKIKSDPVLLARHKKKERIKYIKKKEKGHRKYVNDMTSRERRTIRKKWKKYSSDYRKNQQVRKDVTENTPPLSDEEFLEENRAIETVNDLRRAEAKRRSFVHRKVRNIMLKNKNDVISNLKRKLNTQQKKYKRLKQSIKMAKKALTPQSKIEQMAEDPFLKKELVKKALFGEVIHTQISDNSEKDV